MTFYLQAQLSVTLFLLASYAIKFANDSNPQSLENAACENEQIISI